jgi:PAS domain S-box-containing protein
MVGSNFANPRLENAAPPQLPGLVELLPCPALVYSAGKTILAANRLFRELLGDTLDELAQRQLDDLTDRLDNWRDDAAAARLLKEQLLEVNYDKRFIARSGGAIRCEVALKRIAEDGPACYLALVRPLGEQQADEDELILQAIDEGFIVLDREFRIRRINDAALRIDGRPRSALVGRTHWEAWPGSETLPIADAYRKAMRERTPISVEQAYCHEGRDMWLEARAFPFGEGLAVLYRNITERKHAEQALRDSELAFRTLADNIAQQVWMADSRGDVFWYNKRWFEYTGTTLEEMRGWGWTRVHHPDHVERVLARYRRQVVEEQCTWEDTFPVRGADGRYRWFLSRAVPIRDEHGSVLRWLGTNTDITLQRETEQAPR